MRILIIGGGGREHALAWRAAQSENVEHVFVAPGNAGTAREAKISNITCGVDETRSLIDFAVQKNIELTIVGPELPLAAGIVDDFAAAGLRCFGPSKKAAALESSKSFTKELLKRHGVATAEYAAFTDAEAARAYVRERGAPIVVKADGLASGKGVVVAADVAQAEAAIASMLDEDKFGAAGRRVLIEEFLDGEELSFMVVTDGEHVLPLVGTRDHKSRDEGGAGPNTGGMGAYSPAPFLDPALERRIMREVIQPTLRGMQAEGRPYQGFLYAGLMISATGEPCVLEFNCRLGDPEAQIIMMRLRSDLPELCLATLEGRLPDLKPDWDPRAALGVVMAAEGYPGDARRGDAIEGINREFPPNVKIFHAGSSEEQGVVRTAGGRVLSVVAMEDDLAQARRTAYANVEHIRWDGAFYRKDIGASAAVNEAGH